MPSTIDTLRAEAKSLRALMNFSYSTALDAVARQHGYLDWRSAAILAPKEPEVEAARHIRPSLLRKIIAEYRQENFLITRTEVRERLAREYPGKRYSDTRLTDMLLESPLVSMQQGGLLNALVAPAAEQAARPLVESQDDLGGTESAR